MTVDLRDNEPRGSTQIADGRTRRTALIVVGVGLMVGLVGLVFLEHFRSDWEGWLAQEIAQWLRHPARGGFIMFLLASPLWVLGWYLGRVVRRTEVAQRWPPPDLPVLRDAPIVSEDGAMRQLRLLRLAAVLSWLVPILCGFWFWGALTMLGE